MSSSKPKKKLLNRRHLVVPVLVLAGATTALAGVMSSAIFTDATTNTPNVLTTGIIDLTTSPASGSLTVSGLMPGDTKVAPLTVTNSGDDPLRYSLATVISADVKGLAPVLNVNTKTGVTTCTEVGFAGTGTAVGAQQPLSTFALGSAVQGNQAGDRTLAAGASEVLCVQVTLPLATTNAQQAASATATFNFAAEQTKNNP